MKRTWWLFLLFLSVWAYAYAGGSARGSGFNEGVLEMSDYPILFDESQTDPGIPLSDRIQLYAKDKAGVTTLYTQDALGTVSELGSPDLSGVLSLDQDPAQTVSGGSPIFSGGITTGEIESEVRLIGSGHSEADWGGPSLFSISSFQPTPIPNNVDISSRGFYLKFTSGTYAGNTYEISKVQDATALLGAGWEIITLVGISFTYNETAGWTFEIYGPILKLPSLIGDGFIKTGDGDGTLYVDTSSYLKLSQSPSQTISGGQPIQSTLTASQIVATDANKKFQTLAVATYPSLTELSYVKGVTSAIQTQLNNKQPSGSYLTAETDPLSLHLDQTTPQTITASPVFNWGTDTRIPFYSATNSLIDDEYLTFDAATDILGARNLTIPDTNDALGIHGIIYKGSSPFIHNYHKLFAVDGTTPLDGQNLFIGKDAGNFTMGNTATTAEQSSNNLAIGKEALKSLTTGYDNIAIGALSSSKITGGRGNVYIGANAGAATTTLSFNIGIGQDSVKTAGGSGGNLVGVGYETLMNVQQGGGHVAFGTSAGRTINTGSQGSFIGYRAGYYARGDASTFVGSEAGSGGSSTNSTGTYNTAVGYQALRGYTTGASNSVFGANAGDSITTGTYNVAIGRDTLQGATSAVRNTAVGSGALFALTSSGSDNVAVGYQPGYYNTGNENIFIGRGAGIQIASGANKTTGQKGIYIGAYSRANALNLTDEIVIGHTAFGNGNNTATIGNTNQTDAYIRGNIRTLSDTDKHYFGAGNDASIYYDGTNAIINPKVVGTGYLNIQGQTLVDDKIMFTQTDGNEYIDSLADGYMDYGATTAHRFSGPIHAVHKAADGTAAVADGTYTVGIGTTTDGTITIKDGIITAIQEAS